MERHLKLFSPKPGFPSGFFLRFYQRRLEFLEELAGSNCPVAYFPFAGEKMYLVNEPDLIRDVLVLNHRRFKKGRGLERAKILLGEGLLTSDRRGITSNHWNFARIGGRRSFARRCRVLPFSLLAVPRGNVSARGLPGWKWPSYWLFCSETGIWSSRPGSRSALSRQ
jgi:hypothetical protein